jgi:hypothetical protein
LSPASRGYPTHQPVKEPVGRFSPDGGGLRE